MMDRMTTMTSNVKINRFIKDLTVVPERPKQRRVQMVRPNNGTCEVVRFSSEFR